MQKIKLVIVLAIFLAQFTNSLAQNIIQLYDFETASDGQDIINSNAGVNNVSKSDVHFLSGAWSLRVKQLAQVLDIPYVASGNGGYSFWIYIPKSENPSLTEPVNSRILEIWKYIPSSQGNVQSKTRCNSQGYPSTNFPLDQWVQITPYLQGEDNIGIIKNTDSIVYYIDKVELSLNTPISSNPYINGNYVSFSPTGGVNFIEAHDQLNSNYSWSYSWQEFPSHPYLQGWRDNLSPGTYHVQIVRYSAVHSGQFLCLPTRNLIVNISETIPFCEYEVPISAGSFKLDKYSGQIVFDKGDNCTPLLPIGCIEGQVDAPKLTKVVSASATTFSDNWGTNLTGYQPWSNNEYENGQRGKWRPESSYAFNTGIDYQNKGKNYEAGRFNLANFNWQNPFVNTKSGWMLANTVTAYSPHGDPIEEKNALGIYSTAKFGYRGSVPYLIAQNASYESVMYESFENEYSGSVFEEGVGKGSNLVTTTAHAGKSGLQLNTSFVSRSIKANNKTIQVRFWARGDVSVSTLAVTATSGTSSPIKKVAQSGTWTLWESTVSQATGNITISINKTGGSSIWIDDVRIQPADAEMTCYVYDPSTLRLLAVFDDQHFGLYYQYNDEGKLVRKLIETERGKKTIQETQYNIPAQ